MNYDFGDILDARSTPSVKHFILIVGEVSNRGQTEVMYYIITSRVYAVFPSIISYFNDCILRKDKEFLKFFGKEKQKAKDGLTIKPHGLLSQAVFLDKETDYPTCLEVESMIVIKRDPELIDKTVIERLKTDGKIIYKNKLTKLNALTLKEVINHSDNVSQNRKSKVGYCFNQIKSSLR